MFSALRSLIPLRQENPPSTTPDSGSNSPASAPTEHNVLLPMSPMSRVTFRRVSTLHIDDDTIPGSFLLDRNADESHVSANIDESSSALEPSETLITAATLTSSPLGTSCHNKLFSGASEFY
ncbi:hypothetical protein EV361DRAFT_955705 [Lentinula raphanica]|nr:hypothetical protein EV361DRAFT_955705 [Lentinula raphanica]